MARKATLKVYRTAIGFHDAYVAAASQKAALEAWGSVKNLFARGVAELVADPALAEEPLASPGKVIKRLRGSADEQMAALPPDKPRSTSTADKQTAAPAKSHAVPKPKAKPKPAKPSPPPSRAKLERADAALEAFDAGARDQLADIARRERELASEKKKLLAKHEHDRAGLSGNRDQEVKDYDRALRAWRADDRDR